ncbi:MAG: right-handed parallel beta-helix repeat-containing protein [Kiritimatiellae bacterium]|nr:right-handed parallel beta-helix repeat-containing protein [Kiritimatiellia bacterium]
MCAKMLTGVAMSLLVCLAGPAADTRAAEGNVTGGRQYYVSTRGDDSNPGTIAQPFKTIQKAVDVSAAGDTVLIREGRYGGFQVKNKHGRPDAWITYKNYPGEQVVVDGCLGSVDGRILHIVGGYSCYLVFDGFAITYTDPVFDEARKLDLTKAEHIEIFKRKYIKDKRVRLNAMKLNPPRSGERHHHMIFRNLAVHHVPDGAFAGTGDDIQFIGNHVYDIGGPLSGYGWYAGGNRWVFRGNVVHDCTGYGLHCYNTCAVDDSLVEGNRIWGNGKAYWHNSSRRVKKGGAGILMWGGDNNIVRNNVVFGNDGCGISVKGHYNKVVNNTVVGNGRRGIEVSQGSGNTVVNNIAFGQGQNLALTKDTAAADTPNLTSDPLFVDADGDDYHLRASSAAIDAGTDLSKMVPADFDGVARPAGAAYDIGAYEVAAGNRAPGASRR